MRKNLAVAALVLTPLLARGAQSGVPMELPAPIVLPAWTDSVKVSKAILSACARRHWIAQADDGHSITAELDARSHKAIVRIDYSPKEVRFAYAGSEELAYEVVDGVPHIHSKFNAWVRALAREVLIQAQAAALERELPDVVAPTPPAPAGPAEPIAGMAKPQIVVQEAPGPLAPAASANPQAPAADPAAKP